MKDFDTLRSQREQRERTFKIAGHEFRFRPALPARTYSLYVELFGKMADGQWPEGSFEILNATMEELLEPEFKPVWAEVMQSNIANPVSFEDISKVIDYCIAVNAGRPTNPLSDSGITDESGSTKLTAVSDSPEPLAQTVST